MSTSQDFEFFEAGAAESSQVFELWCSVFSWSDETKKIISDRLQAGFRAGTVRLPAVRFRRTGALAAALRLEYWTFPGKENDKDERVVHVGEVAVLPEYQGCGIGTFLMEHTVELLKKDVPCADYAFLGGYTGFYSRFGFRPVDAAPRLEVPLAPERGGTKRFSILERLPRPEAGVFRPFSPETDGESVIQLQRPGSGERKFDRATLEREFIFRKNYFEQDCFVVPEKNGKLSGYLFRCDSGIYSFGFSKEEIRDQLLSEAFHRIGATGSSTLSISGNLDQSEIWLREKQIPFRKISPVGGICSSMRLQLKDRPDDPGRS